MCTLSIDFGTSYCAAAYLDESNIPQSICFSQNEYNAKCYKIPTVIQYTSSETGEECKIIGEAALVNLVQSEHHDSSIISKIKTELREKGYWINGQVKKSVDIVADIISNIKQIAEKDANKIFTKLVLTHPAQYEELKKMLLKNAAKKCGFEDIILLEEPIAATYAFIEKHNLPKNKGAIVFDYGGGTIDIAYIYIENAGSFSFKFRPISKPQCGGEYMDLLLHNKIISHFKVTNTNHINPILLNHCTRAKINFSSFDEQTITFNGKSKTISIEKFNEIISPKVKIALELLKNIVQRCNEKNYNIDYVFLNGGSSRLKLVIESIKQILPKANILEYGGDDLAVAIGAILSTKPQQSTKDEGIVVIKNDAIDKIRNEYKKNNK